MTFEEKLLAGKFVVTSEIGPPKGIETHKLLEDAELIRGRVDGINVTDLQSSVMRLGSLVVCSLLKQKGFEPIFQMTCRDRNRLALQSDLLSAAALGIENVLILTGDHTTMGDHPEAKPVFDLDSVQLLQVVKKKNPVISWKWNVDRFPEKKTKESLETENEDDFAARVYVIFPAMFFTNSRVLEYVWAESLPVGSTGTSPYSKNIKLMALESGAKKEWVFEERDIRADYVAMFGHEPEYNIGAVAFMTNAEHTASSAVAVYNEIKLGYREGGGK